MALIKCSECGKEISDKATNCIHCGCPINVIENKETKKLEKEKKKNQNDNKKVGNNKLDDKVLNIIDIVSSILLAVIMFFFITEITFDNFIVAIIVALIYGVAIFVVYKLMRNKFDKIKRTYKIISLLGITVVPLVIAIILINSTEGWSYFNYSSYGDTQSYYLDLNVFGKCYYAYSNLDKDIDKTSRECSWEKSNDKYTFYITETGSYEEYSFDCKLEDGKLKCPLQYSYPRSYIYLKRN